MLNNGNNGVLVALCKQSVDAIIHSGGVVMPSPRVNRNRVETTTKYVVCCDQNQGNAFLIGMIDKVIWVDDECVIKINSYALINKTGVWHDVGTKAGFAYLENPSQIHLYAGRLKFKSIGNGNGKYGNSNSYTDEYLASKDNEVKVPAIASATTSATKKSAIVVYPKPKQDYVSHLDRIQALRKELAELEANKLLVAQDLVNKLYRVLPDLDNAMLDSVIKFCEDYTK